MENSACLGVKNIGKPCALIAHARFDEGGQVKTCSLLYRIKFALHSQRSMGHHLDSLKPQGYGYA